MRPSARLRTARSERRRCIRSAPVRAVAISGLRTLPHGIRGSSLSNSLFEHGGSVWRSSTDENGAYRRRPPLTAALRGRDLFGVEVPRDLAHALALGVSSADVGDQLGREPRLATGPRSLANSSRLPALGEVALELDASTLWQ